MSRGIFPNYSKTQVNKAGKAVRDGNASLEQILIIENWRASHTHILNTFQANLRRRVKGKRVVFAQRLKRRDTIFDKLQREEGMSLARMHDIAGCRLIFDSIKTLKSFRDDFHKAKFSHIRKNINADDYNYIISPKISGYRGIHDVYEYVGSKTGSKWNGLLIEIQFRTKYQHAWATAVEIAGSVTENQPKFNKGDERHKEFFRLASEMIARVYEKETSCFPELSNAVLIEQFTKLESEIHLLRTLEGINTVNTQISKGRNVILVFSETNKTVKAYAFNNPSLAIRNYFELEKTSSHGDDIVLVRADTSDNIRNAFRNYFSDAKDFVAYMKKAIQVIENDL